MHAAPAFELGFGLSRIERIVLAVLVAAASAAVALGIWSHVDAAAGLAGRGLLPWLVVGSAATTGGCALGWLVAPKATGTIRWHQERWTLRRAGEQWLEEGIVEAKLDLGSWMLLRFRSVSGRALWFGADRQRAGAAWHALRATLYAPAVSRRQASTGGGESS
jgi:hypothetical protein